MKYEYITVIVITVRAAPIPSCYYRASWKNCISISIYIHYYTLTYTTGSCCQDPTDLNSLILI